jgi:selenocysteine lyase/cysteine desulfurase
MIDRTDSKGNFIEYYRKEFPVVNNYVYLDNAGVAPISLRALEAAEKFLRESSESGAYRHEQFMKRVEEVRETCAALIHARSDEIAFVKNTSQGLSIVAGGIDWKVGDNVLVYKKEFPSNIYPWLQLERRGIELRFIPSRKGRILIGDIEGLIDSQTRLLTISSVQYSNGFRIDLKSVGDLCKRKGIFFCVDAIQSLGVVPMDVRGCNVDFLAADGHKWLFSPEGTGIFYCRRELAEKIEPPLIGWKSIKNEYAFDRVNFDLKKDARRFEEGSLNVVGIYALGAAVDLLLEIGIERIEQRVLDLGTLIMRLAEERGLVTGTPKEREARGGIVSLFGDFDPHAVRKQLRELGMIVSVREDGLRLSPGFFNTENEIYRFYDAFDKIAALR